MKTPTPSIVLRSWLASQLRRRDVPDWLWVALEGSGLLAAPDRPETRSEIVREARRRLRAIRRDAAAPTGGPRAPREISLLSKTEERRAWAFSNYLADTARGDRDIEMFRDRVLGGRLLSRGEAIELLRSEAPLYLDLSDFAKERVPLLGHKYGTVGLHDGAHTNLRWPQFGKSPDVEAPC